MNPGPAAIQAGGCQRASHRGFHHWRWWCWCWRRGQQVWPWLTVAAPHAACVGCNQSRGASLYWEAPAFVLTCLVCPGIERACPAKAAFPGTCLLRASPCPRAPLLLCCCAAGPHIVALSPTGAQMQCSGVPQGPSERSGARAVHASRVDARLKLGQRWGLNSTSQTSNNNNCMLIAATNCRHRPR